MRRAKAARRSPLAKAGFIRRQCASYGWQANFREVIRLPACKSGVTKQNRKQTNWSVTSTSHQPSLVNGNELRLAGQRQ